MDKVFSLLAANGFRFAFDQSNHMFVRGYIASFLVHSTMPEKDKDKIWSLISRMSDEEFSEMARKY
jgi:hypothetical protein